MAISSLAAAAANDGGVLFDDIRNQQAEIRAGVVAKSGRYRDMPETTRNELLLRQTRMLSTIDGKKVPTDLDQEQRTRVFNDLEWIEAAINRTQDERLVCEYTRTIGSNRKQRVCRTAEQIRLEHERSRDELDRQSTQVRR
ncbi:hypothetical protein [Lysobacter terrae]